jgi:hypothetical protein
MPYSGLALAGTGTRTGASAGAPVEGVPTGFGTIWAMLVAGGVATRTVVSASMAVKRLNILISVEVVGRRRRPLVVGKSRPGQIL